MYWFLKFYSFCLEKLPKLFLKINYKIHYFLLFHILKLRKEMAIENLRSAFPEKDNNWHNTMIKKCYQFYVEEVVDFLSKYAYFDSEKVHLNNVHILDEALQEEKGIILVSGHFGSFHKLFVAMAKNGYKNIAGISYKQNNREASKFFLELRKPYIANEMHKGGPSSEVKKSLQNNEMLILLSDQDAGKKGIFVNFFNKPSSTPSGAARYHQTMGSPLVFFSMVKTNNHHEANFERIDTTNMSIEDTVQKYTSMLEQRIRKYPEQYFWPHKRWKTKPQ